MSKSAKSDTDPLKRSQSAKVDNFGTRVKTALDGRSMAWLAGQTGISTSMLSDYGKGKSPSAEKAADIADATGVDLRWLVTGRGEAHSSVSKATEAEFDQAAPELDQPEEIEEISYSRVEVLPSYAGAGGGGTGQGDRTLGLVPNSLIIDELHGKPEDFLLINIRGDSMEPDFYHGDQALVDKRDRSPAQAGPFALFDSEWGEYLVKNVERAEGSMLRVFSSNPKYREKFVTEEDIRVIGRPIWIGRRL